MPPFEVIRGTMAQISDDALRKVLQPYISLNLQVVADIEARAITSAQGLQQVQAQMSTTEREKKMLQFTQKELESYPLDTPVYVGVGKM